MLGQAEPFDAVVATEGGDLDDFFGGTILEDLGDEGELHVGRRRLGMVPLGYDDDGASGERD